MNGDGTSGICNNDGPASNGERRMSVFKPRVMMTLGGGGGDGDDDAGWKRRTLLMPVMHAERARLGQTQGVLRSNWTQSRYPSNQFYRLLLPSGTERRYGRDARTS